MSPTPACSAQRSLTAMCQVARLVGQAARWSHSARPPALAPLWSSDTASVFWAGRVSLTHLTAQSCRGACVTVPSRPVRTCDARASDGRHLFTSGSDCTAPDLGGYGDAGGMQSAVQHRRNVQPNELAPRPQRRRQSANRGGMRAAKERSSGKREGSRRDAWARMAVQRNPRQSHGAQSRQSCRDGAARRGSSGRGCGAEFGFGGGAGGILGGAHRPWPVPVDPPPPTSGAKAQSSKLGLGFLLQERVGNDRDRLERLTRATLQVWSASWYGHNHFFTLLVALV
jgi:hypothetical protein